MSVWYNENDRQKAAWLRHLIEEGEIAAGVVDERSIAEVQPDDLAGFDQHHFFAGVGLWSLCLRRAGWPDDRPVWTGSCPCGPFSVAGKGLGFDDPRHLWPEWFRLIRERRPDCIFGEQSDAAVDWIDLVSADLEGDRYAIGSPDLPAAGFGGHHRRQRFSFVATATHASWWTARAPWADGSWPRTGRVAHADLDGREQGDGRRSLWAERHPEHGGGARELGDASRHGSPSIGRDHGQVRGLSEDERQPEHRAPISGRPGAAFGLVDPASGGCRMGQGGVSYLFQPDSTGAVDWLLCRDRRWRPVEPGLSPLIDAHPSRMGRLRAYGDAIDVEVFTNLIAAYLDCAPPEQIAA